VEGEGEAGGGGRKGTVGKAGRGREGEGKGWKSRPPRSFLKVGAYMQWRKCRKSPIRTHPVSFNSLGHPERGHKMTLGYVQTGDLGMTV